MWTRIHTFSLVLRLFASLTTAYAPWPAQLAHTHVRAEGVTRRLEGLIL